MNQRGLDLDCLGNDSLRQIRLVGNILYNWEGGKWHQPDASGLALPIGLKAYF